MSTPAADPAMSTPEENIRNARMLAEALPFMQRYAGATLVVKYGGHAMGDESLGRDFARDIVLLKQVGLNPIVVHGGGPQIGRMLDRLKIQSEFVDGLRVTDTATVEIVEMVLAGSINKQIVAMINQAGGKAVGISGKDANLIQARKLTRTKRDPDSNIEKVLDLGFVGDPDRVDTTILDVFKQSSVIPVVAPIGIGADGETYNINADTVAGAIAGAVSADRLLLLTDVAGVKGKDGDLIASMSRAEAEAMIADGTISGGMIPKVETCLDAVARGVEAAVILDGRVPHAVLLEIFTEHGVGTLIRRS
ncbi:acetylglutamate kinase [Constrictibacter sp. MBR-5]|jgi:acetylglutamate kinase|uniref:acetylglutamate kinase n=1 Tax=Constrictibacter sp. MBR-5 TaxID=3156467 RepID=UPI003396AA3F